MSAESATSRFISGWKSVNRSGCWQMRTSAFPRHTKGRKAPRYMRPFIRDIEDKQVSTHCPPDDPPLIEIGYFPFYADELLCFFYFSSNNLHTFYLNIIQTGTFDF